MKRKTRIVLSVIILIVLLAALFLTLFSRDLLFSPESGMAYEDARNLLIGLGENGKSWYCGFLPSYTDDQRNYFDQTSLKELKKILGNEKQLKEEFCN